VFDSFVQGGYFDSSERRDKRNFEYEVEIIFPTISFRIIEALPELPVVPHSCLPWVKDYSDQARWTHFILPRPEWATTGNSTKFPSPDRLVPGVLISIDIVGKSAIGSSTGEHWSGDVLTYTEYKLWYKVTTWVQVHDQCGNYAYTPEVFYFSIIYEAITGVDIYIPDVPTESELHEWYLDPNENAGDTSEDEGDAVQLPTGESHWVPEQRTGYVILEHPDSSACVSTFGRYYKDILADLEAKGSDCIRNITQSFEGTTRQYIDCWAYRGTYSVQEIRFDYERNTDADCL
jgi:hypothetical protein